MQGSGDPGGAQPRPPRTWWQRNWKWFLPVSILGGLVLVTALVGGTLLFVFGLFIESDVYAEAMARARANPEVVRALGEPIVPGFWVTGTLKLEGPSGSADFRAPVSGPGGHGTIYITAKKEAGRWRFDTLEVEVEGVEDRIPLLASAE